MLETALSLLSLPSTSKTRLLKCSGWIILHVEGWVGWMHRRWTGAFRLRLAKTDTHEPKNLKSPRYSRPSRVGRSCSTCRAVARLLPLPNNPMRHPCNSWHLPICPTIIRLPMVSGVSGRDIWPTGSRRKRSKRQSFYASLIWKVLLFLASSSVAAALINSALHQWIFVPPSKSPDQITCCWWVNHISSTYYLLTSVP